MTTPAPQESETAAHSEKWKAIVKPLRQHQSVEDMIQEQGYKAFDRIAFDCIIEALDIQDPNNELLKLTFI